MAEESISAEFLVIIVGLMSLKVISSVISTIQFLKSSTNVT